jgi:hypothetical protein
MRPWIIGLLLLSAGCAGGNASLDPRPAGGYHVLFIGNSLTYVNDLPGTVAALASSVDDTIRVESVTRPNFALIDHVNGMSDAVEVIGRGDWDYVVLQQGPTTQQIGRDTLILAVRLLDPEIRAAGGRPATLMVWPPSGNRAAFDQVLASYRQAADSVGGLLLPAGEAWRSAWDADANLRLYGPDDFHPSALGTYLAALVVYEGITGHDARGLPHQAVVSGQTLEAPPGMVALLQRMAHETVARFHSASSGAVPDPRPAFRREIANPGDGDLRVHFVGQDADIGRLSHPDLEPRSASLHRVHDVAEILLPLLDSEGQLFCVFPEFVPHVSRIE